MVTIESKMSSVIYTRLFFLCQSLDPHLTTYHANIGVHIIIMFYLGSTSLMRFCHVIPFVQVS